MNPVLIFVRPQAHGNVGAIARVMSNFGCQDLRLVQEVAGKDAYGQEESPIDWGMACGGQKILENKIVYSTLQEAIADVDFVLGTTARIREGSCGYTREHLEVASAFEFVKNQVTKSEVRKWALVIGAENDGLNDQETSFCHKLAFIQTQKESPSMNAAMAAGVLLFYWNQINVDSISVIDTDKITKDRGRENFASLGDKEKFLEYLTKVLELTAFFKYPDQEASKARFRRWIQGAQIEQGELLYAFEALYHLKCQITGFFEKRNFLDQEEN